MRTQFDVQPNVNRLLNHVGLTGDWIGAVIDCVFERPSVIAERLMDLRNQRARFAVTHIQPISTTAPGPTVQVSLRTVPSDDDAHSVSDLTGYWSRVRWSPDFTRGSVVRKCPTGSGSED